MRSALSSQDSNTAQVAKGLPVVILNRPQQAENIGLCARSMMNFGFSEVRLVDPRDGWPQENAFGVAKKGECVLRAAGVFPSIPEACHDISLLYASTARNRFLNKEQLALHEASREISELCLGEGDSDGENRGARVGILFGQERTGLTNEEISYATKIIHIPTNPEYPSLNLGVSVSVVCYALSCAMQSFWKNGCMESSEGSADLRGAPGRVSSAGGLATIQDLSYLFKAIEDRLVKREFLSNEEQREKTLINIRNIFSRRQLSKREFRTLMGIIQLI